MRARCRLSLGLLVWCLSASLGAQEWNELETPHFRLIFTSESAWAAQEMALWVEEVYEQLTPYWNYRPQQVPVILDGLPDQANGYFAFAPRRLRMMVHPPSDNHLGVPQGAWLRFLFVHEFSHFLHLTRPRGFFGGLSSVFGPDSLALQTLFLPGWMIEGWPMLQEHLDQGSGRLASPWHSLWVKAQDQTGKPWTLNQGSYDSDRYPPGRWYIIGAEAVQGFEKDFGPGFFREFDEEFSRWPFLGWSRAFRQIAGENPQQAWNNLIQQRQQRYASAEAQAGWPHPLPEAQPLSPEDSSWSRPRWAAGTWWAYARGERRLAGLYSLTPEGWVLRARFSALDSSSWDVTEDGQRVVYARYRLQRRAEGDWAQAVLEAQDLETGSVTYLNEGYHKPAVQPGTGRILALGFDQGLWQLDLLEPEGAFLERLYRGPSLPGFPAWSASGESLAVTFGAAELQQIRVYSLASQEWTDVGPDSRSFWTQAGAWGAVSWQDERHLLIPGGPWGAIGLYRLALDPETGPQLIWADPVGLWGAASGPGVLAYEAPRAAGTRLFLVNAENLIAFQDLQENQPPLRTERKTSISPQPGPLSPSVVNSARSFYDWPGLVFWGLEMRYTETEAIDWRLAEARIFLEGRNLLETSSWSLSVGNPLGILHPVFSIQWNQALSGGSVSLEAFHNYQSLGSPNLWRARTGFGFTSQTLVAELQDPRYLLQLNLGTGFSGTLTSDVQSPRPFEWGHIPQLHGGVALQFQLSESGRARESFYGPSYWLVQSRALWDILGLSREANGRPLLFWAKQKAQAALGLWQLGTEIQTAISPIPGLALQEVAAPGGWPGGEDTAPAWAWGFELGLGLPRESEIPWGGWAWLREGVKVSLRSRGTLKEELKPEGAWYLGFELGSLAAFNLMSLPWHGGLVLRLQNDRAFEPVQDLRFYAGVGLSFP